MAIHTSGLDSPTAHRVPAGTTIERVYWSVPDHGTTGPEYDTEAAAIAAGLAEQEALIARDREFRGTESLIPERFCVDLRWAMKFPGGGLDTPVSRTTYDTFADAREHLARIEKYARR